MRKKSLQIICFLIVCMCYVSSYSLLQLNTTLMDPTNTSLGVLSYLNAGVSE